MKRGSVFVLLMCIAAAGGCMSQARPVKTTKDGGTVAIPNGTNEFPYYYRNDALELIEKQVGGKNYQITTEGPVTLSEPVPAGSPPSNKTEYQINYIRVPGPMSATTSGNRFPTTGGPVPTTGLMPSSGTGPAQGLAGPSVTPSVLP